MALHDLGMLGSSGPASASVCVSCASSSGVRSTFCIACIVSCESVGAESPLLTSGAADYLPRNMRPRVSSITIHPPGTVFQRPFSTGETEIAGFEDISFYRSDKPIKVGGDVEEALEVVKSLGPAGEIIRLAGERADPFMPQIDAKLREMYVEYTDPDGAVRAPASVWIISARAAG